MTFLVATKDACLHFCSLACKVACPLRIAESFQSSKNALMASIVSKVVFNINKSRVLFGENFVEECLSFSWGKAGE